MLSLANLLESPEAPRPFRQASAESLHALLRAVDLIPDGLEELGYLEVAFAFRVLAQRALLDNPELASSPGEGRVPRLAADSEIIAELLGDDFATLSELAFTPEATLFAGRFAQDLLEDDELRASVLADARAWAEDYRAPRLEEGPEELVKIRSFFATRLRRPS